LAGARWRARELRGRRFDATSNAPETTMNLDQAPPLRPLGALLAALAALTGPGAADSSPGWQATLRPDPGGSIAELADGRLLSFDGQFVQLFDAAGATSVTLHDFGLFQFSGALELAPDETYAIVGESSTGGIWRVELDGSGVSFLATLDFNYDAAFAPDGSLYVSAAVNGFGAPNDVLRVDPVSGATTLVARLDGPSGPIDFDAQGNLFYATQSPLFPAPAGSTDVVFLTEQQLSSAVVETLADAQTFAAGFDGGGSLAIDRSSGAVYLAENNFGSGVNRLRLVAGSAGSSPTLFEGPAFQSIAIDCFHASASSALFAPYQPTGAGRLVFSRTDYVTVDERLTLEPRRPELALSGPGTVASGGVTLDFDGLPPFAACLLFFAAGGTQPSVVLPNSVPLFVEIDLATAAAFPFALASDAAGDASVTLFNPGTLGALSFQGLAYGLSGGSFQVFGTSTAAGL
jgi:hypothetical protein